MLRKLLPIAVFVVLLAGGMLAWHVQHGAPSAPLTPLAAKSQPTTPDPLPGTAADVGPAPGIYSVTALADGSVLIVGAGTPDGAGMELVNPDGKVLPLPQATMGDGASYTLLADGRVLVAGGFVAGVKAEDKLYKPQDGSVQGIGQLAEARVGHTATLLQDGRVLIAGGSDYVKPVDDAGTGNEGDVSGNAAPHYPLPLRASAEVYDPATRGLSQVAAMDTGRIGHSATLLPDGRILLAGGTDADGHPMKSAELWDPAAARFTPAAPMLQARTGHTATVLASGKVLFVGGYAPQPEAAQSGAKAPPFVNAELYDPRAGKSVALPGTHFDTRDHSATLLADGRVLLLGDNEAGLGNVEVFDPATSRFTVKPKLPLSRTAHAATLLADGSVLISGGLDQEPESEGASVAGDCWIWHPESDTFSKAPALKQTRSGHTAVRLPNGQVLMASNARSGGLEIWDAAGRGRQDVATAVGLMYAHTATLLQDGQVLIAGGAESDGAPHAEAMLYDPVTRMLRYTGSMNVARHEASATLLADGRVLIAGGDGAPMSGKPVILNSTEVYDPKTGTFTLVGQLRHPRRGHQGLLLADGHVFIFGGMGGFLDHAGTSNQPTMVCPGAELWEVASGNFTDVGKPNARDCSSTATLLKDGRVLMAGGNRSPIGAEIYDPKSRQFSVTGYMVIPRYDFQALTLHDGRVLMAGTMPPGVVGKPDSDAPPNAPARAELYEPDKGGFIGGFTFAGAGAIRHVVELSGGRLLVIGEQGSVIVDEVKLPHMAEQQAGR